MITDSIYISENKEIKISKSDKPLIYYAHCLAIYNTAQENRDIKLLESFGFCVINPNCSAYAEGYLTWNMDLSEWVVERCDYVAFRALPDGAISSGVAKEIEFANKHNKPVIELPSCISRRVLTVDQTREFLREIGNR
jgi:hypothetical protein